MAAITSPTPVATVGVHVKVPAWAFLLMVVGLFGCYVALQENGALLSSWETVHELFHDARHVVGVPCH